MPPKLFHSVKPYAWASLRWTDTICRMKPENEAAMEYIGYDKSWGNMQKMLEDNEIDKLL